MFARNSSCAHVALVVCFALVNWACPSTTEQPPIVTAIEGTIRVAGTNAPVDGATITTEPPTSSITTGTDGTYRLTENLTDGTTYRVRATKMGFGVGEVMVTVTEGQVATADMLLSATTPMLSVDRQTVDFGENGTVETVVVSNTGDMGSELEFRASSVANWIQSVEPAMGTVTDTPANVVITADRSVLGMNYQRYTADIEVTSNGGSFTVVATLDHVDPTAPIIGLMPESIDFATAATMRMIEVRNLGQGTLEWQMQNLPGWLTADITSADVEAGQRETVTLTADRAGLPVGTQTATITFMSNDRMRPMRRVPVTITVEARPELTVDPMSIDFTDQFNQRAFDIVNSGTGPLDYQVADSTVNWLTVSTMRSGTLQGGMRTTITLDADRTPIPPGSAMTTLAITSNATNFNLPISITRTATPALVVTPDPAAAGPAETVDVTVRNAGLGTLNWSIGQAASWLSASRTSGVLVSSFGAPPAEETVTFTIDRTNLNGGQATGTVEFVSNGGTLTIRVTALVPDADWTQVNSPQTPGRRSHAAFAWDRERNLGVLFGGTGLAGALNDTWTFDGTAWTQDTSMVRPPARSGATMAFDSANDRILMYGGSNNAGDLWAYDENGWSQITTMSTPVARTRMGSHFDGSLLFLAAGLDANGTPVTMSSVFNGSDWMTVPLVAPRAVDALSFGVNANTLSILAIPCDAAGMCTGLTLYSATRTTPPVPVRSLPATLHREGYAGFARMQQHYYFGGEGASGLSNEIVQVPVAGLSSALVTNVGPSPRRDATIAYDQVSDRAVLFGGSTGAGLVSETWVLDFP